MTGSGGPGGERGAQRNERPSSRGVIPRQLVILGTVHEPGSGVQLAVSGCTTTEAADISSLASPGRRRDRATAPAANPPHSSQDPQEVQGGPSFKEGSRPRKLHRGGAVGPQ